MNTPTHAFAIVRRRPAIGVGVGLSLGLLAACGGDDDDERVEDPPALASIAFSASTPCGSDHPTPSDLFRDASGRSETSECNLPDDPLDAAVARVEQAQYAPLDSVVRLPLDGMVSETSLSSTVSLSFSGSGDSAGLPPVALVEEIDTDTSTPTYRAVAATVTLVEDAIELRPDAELLPGRFHVAIVTRAVLADDGVTPLEPSPEVEALLGDAPIAAGTVAGLDETGAARLERMRVALQGTVRALAEAQPPIRGEDIVSIHGFTTRAGAELYPNIVARYDEAIRKGTYGYQIRIDETGIAPAAVYDQAANPAAYENVGSFTRGVIMVPKFLDGNRLRANWETVAEMVEVPFLMSVPRTFTTNFPVAIHTVGVGRARIDARGLANAMGGGPAGSAMAIELRCHGRRSPGEDGVCGDNRTDAEVAALVDVESNNENPFFSGADGIPDASGVGYFPGDPLELIDTQIATTLEIIHVVATLRQRTGNPFEEAGLAVDRSGIHLVAQGYTAVPGAAAAAFADGTAIPRTLTFAAGGAGLADLILDGKDEQRQAFLAELPDGVAEEQARTLLTRLRPYLAPLEIETWGDRLSQDRYRRQGVLRGLLLPHPRAGAAGTRQFVSAEARDNLRQALELPSKFVSQHLARCDDFFIFTCIIGDNPFILEEARGQIAAFISSNGSTVTDPYRE